MTTPSEPSLTKTMWDVIVIGGGPAGSTAATTLAQAGRRVLLLEKEKFPRFHVGESLLPYNRKIFDDLGVWPKIAAAGFTRKRGAQFLMGNGSHKVRLDFSKGSFTQYPEAVQVERAKFDNILLRHAEENGAEVREQCLVSETMVKEEHVAVKYRTPEGIEHEEKSRFLVDASGLSNFTANREGQREYYSGHKKIAIFGHYSGVIMDEGEMAGDILIIRRANSWFWMIPLERDKVSVGLVQDAADFKASGRDPQASFDDAVHTTQVVQERMVNAKAITQGHVVTDFSYRNETLVSPRVVRAGDASGFIDPIFSSGVLLAMTSGQQGARAIHEALASGQALTAAMHQHEKDTRARIAEYWEFIENFYLRHFAQIFFQPNNRFRMVCAINAVLAGCTVLPWSVRWRLRLFFFLAWVQKRFPVTKRIEVS